MRDVLPRTQTISPIYRTPVLIDTRNGAFSMGSLHTGD
jgi:hypothetical protein